MRGLITSTKAARVWDFISRVGPTPFHALSVATGFKPGTLVRALRHLRGGGYAHPIWQANVEFWGANGAVFEPEAQEMLAWFAARLEEAGGRVENATAHFPRGQVFPIYTHYDHVEVGEWVCAIGDLRAGPLRDCLRKKSKEA